MASVVSVLRPEGGTVVNLKVLYLSSELTKTKLIKISVIQSGFDY